MDAGGLNVPLSASPWHLVGASYIMHQADATGGRKRDVQTSSIHLDISKTSGCWIQLDPTGHLVYPGGCWRVVTPSYCISVAGVKDSFSH